MGSEVTFESILGHFGVGLPGSLSSHFGSLLFFLCFCRLRSTPALQFKSVFSHSSHCSGGLFQQYFRSSPRAHNLKKILGTPAWCPWDNQRDKQGSTGRCPRNCLLFTVDKPTNIGHFLAGTPAGCPGGLEKFCVICLFAFSALYLCSQLSSFTYRVCV